MPIDISSIISFVESIIVVLSAAVGSWLTVAKEPDPMGLPSAFGGIATRVIRKGRQWFKTLHHQPRLKVSKHQHKLMRLGSSYGGWTFVDSRDLINAKIISCGLGEDASFDVEIAKKYNAEVIIVDPTPRSKIHFHDISKRFGKEAETSYRVGGRQLVTSYDLSKITDNNLKFCPKALWNDNKTVRFFTPANKQHVSHSIINYQNNYRNDTPFIEVESITIDELMKAFYMKTIALLKMDIEGAEIEVINDMLMKQIFPTQILVEYDELTQPSLIARERIERCHNLLISKGYRLINIDKPSNLLYVNSNCHEN